MNYRNGMQKQIRNNRFDSVMKTLPSKPNLQTVLLNSTKHLNKDKLIINYSKQLGEKGMLPSSYCKFIISHMPKRNKNTIKKNHRLIFSNHKHAKKKWSATVRLHPTAQNHVRFIPETQRQLT